MASSRRSPDKQTVSESAFVPYDRITGLFRFPSTAAVTQGLRLTVTADSLTFVMNMPINFF